MLSESARMSSAAEARFRLQAPNSRPRSITVVSLDARAQSVVQRLSRNEWTHATFLHANAAGNGLTDLDGNARGLRDEVDAADLVVMVAGPGGHADAATALGRACSDRQVMTTALLVDTASASDEALSKTLAQVRPWSLMVVIADDDEYVDDILTALRA